MFQLEIDEGDELTSDCLYEEVHPKQHAHKQAFAKPKGPAGKRGGRRITQPAGEREEEEDWGRLKRPQRPEGEGGGRVSCSTRLFVKNNFKFLLSSQEMQLCTPRTTEQRHTCVFPFVARRVEAALCLSAHVHLFSVSESRCPSRAIPSPRHLWDIQNATAANVNSSQYDLETLNNLFSSPPSPFKFTFLNS